MPNFDNRMGNVRSSGGGSAPRGRGYDGIAPPQPTAGVKAQSAKSPIYGPPGGLPGLNGQPWMHGDGNLGYGATDGPAQASTAAAPPATTETNYDALFQQSLNNQRGAIDAQLKSVMGDINARHAQADQVVAMQPTEVNALYNQAAPAVDKAAGAATAELGAQGAPATSGQQAGVDAIKAAIETNRGGALADAPYLKIGETDLFNRQAGAAQSASQQAHAAVDAQQADLYGQRANAQFSAQEQAKQSDDSFNKQLQLAMYQNQAKQSAADQQNQALQAATQPGSAKWWQAHAVADPTGANKFGQNFNLDPKILKQWQDNADIWKQSQGNMTPDLVSFLKFRYGLK